MTKFTPKVGNLVYFVWQDHCSQYGAGWRRSGDDAYPDNKPSECHTTGFVVKMDKDCITTAASWDGVDAYSQFATRLRRDIIKGRVIRTD